MSNPLKALANLLLLIIALSFISNDAHANEPLLEFEQAMAKNIGKVVYVDFWASWCVPCRKSFPWMNTMQAQHQEQGLVVLSINLDAQVSLAEKFLLATPANFAIIYDAKGVLAKKFKLKGMPSSYLFNREGKLISAHSGFNAKKQKKYEHEIALLLDQE
ncbi:TlpA family protein disulfide reductase [Colwellia sp. 75C3]|uniref:TlpA disulfide reductase family protein n=1 Tax=Colwellia sp. 75C3 TaxID=888425 RepID=UPI000C3423A4|nr:TlpA disulfide reductase family protein [Colwellia sp. 75C3]PKG85228.1 TlpA family protein disulfide reductase [Colwellia sp. 75C3]